MKVNKCTYKPKKETKDCKNKRLAYINFQYNLDNTIKKVKNKSKKS